MNIVQHRESIRAETLQQRENLLPATRAMLSKHTMRHVIEWIQQSEKSADCYSFHAIMVYLSMKSEVETEVLIEYLFEHGKQIIIPAIDTKNGQLIPRCVRNLEKDLIAHRYGMLEPSEGCPIFPSDQLQLILVPGIAFDSDGYRLGYGKGFYDRFLPTCPNAVTIGIAFQLQLVADTFPQPWDVPVQHIFTEEGML